LVCLALRVASFSRGEFGYGDVPGLEAGPAVRASIDRVAGGGPGVCAGLFNDEPANHAKRLFASDLWIGHFVEWRADPFLRTAADQFHEKISSPVDDGDWFRVDRRGLC